MPIRAGLRLGFGPREVGEMYLWELAALIDEWNAMHSKTGRTPMSAAEAEDLSEWAETLPETITDGD